MHGKLKHYNSIGFSTDCKINGEERSQKIVIDIVNKISLNVFKNTLLREIFSTSAGST